jgi:hypothetical protein
MVMYMGITAVRRSAAIGRRPILRAGPSNTLTAGEKTQARVLDNVDVTGHELASHLAGSLDDMIVADLPTR